MGRRVTKKRSRTVKRKKKSSQRSTTSPARTYAKKTALVDSWREPKKELFELGRSDRSNTYAAQLRENPIDKKTRFTLKVHAALKRWYFIRRIVQDSASAVMLVSLVLMFVLFQVNFDDMQNNSAVTFIESGCDDGYSATCTVQYSESWSEDWGAFPSTRPSPLRLRCARTHSLRFCPTALAPLALTLRAQYFTW
jgi:hypothetical protein